jgi:hypothetical protein
LASRRSGASSANDRHLRNPRDAQARHTCLISKGAEGKGARMGSLSLDEAFAIFGGKPTNRLHSMSGLSSGGDQMILGCSSTRFRHPGPGVLRYEDTLSRETPRAAELRSLGEHLTRARDGDLPIRMIVIKEVPNTTGKVTRTIHVRVDLIGKLVEFDGERFIVDFTRKVEPARGSPRK